MDLFDNGFLTYFAPLLDWLRQPGYMPLLLLSFLASTMLPIGSEWLLALMLTQQYQPAVTVIVATVGNTLGACTTYLVGRYGSGWLLERFFSVSDSQRERAEAWYRRYGSASLLASWLPVVGDPLCLVGGLLKVDPLKFLVLVGIGKLARYAVVAWFTVSISGRG